MLMGTCSKILNRVLFFSHTNICAAVSNKKGVKNIFFDHQLSSLNTISKNHSLFIKKAFGIRDLKKKKIKKKILVKLLKKKKKKKINFINIKKKENKLKILKK